MNINPAQYHRNSKDWHKLLGKTGKVVVSTKVSVASKELEAFLPYCFLIVELEDSFQEAKPHKNGVKKQQTKLVKRIEIMGEAHTEFKLGEKICLELRKIAVPDEKSIIPYGLKACKI